MNLAAESHFSARIWQREIITLHIGTREMEALREYAKVHKLETVTDADVVAAILAKVVMEQTDLFT